MNFVFLYIFSNLLTFAFILFSYLFFFLQHFYSIRLEYLFRITFSYVSLLLVIVLQFLATDSWRLTCPRIYFCTRLLNGVVLLFVCFCLLKYQCRSGIQENMEDMESDVSSLTLVSVLTWKLWCLSNGCLSVCMKCNGNKRMQDAKCTWLVILIIV